MLEREEGRFTFSLIDQFIALLAERKLRVVLCTPTASPPDWLCVKYPEMVPVKMDGTTFGTGVRRHTCPTSPAYRRHCERIVRAMAKRYGSHPSVAAWQIDNEIGDPFCYCPLCHRAFQRWLRSEFGIITNFNFKLGQFFLGRTSRSFEEIPLPESNSNPCLHQAYNRFMDHQIRQCWGLQAQWLREEGVQAPITTNVMLTWYGYDHETFFQNLDFVSGDVYPTGTLYEDDRFPGLAFYSAYLRGIKHGDNFGLMELRCAPVGMGRAYPAPGEIKWWTYAFLAGGANFVHFFRLDTCPSGLERGAYGLIPPSGLLPPAFFELKELCAEVDSLLPWLRETKAPTAPVGLLYSQLTHLSFQHRPELDDFKGPYGNGYTLHLARHFRAVVSQNIPADIVHPGDDFQKYRVLILTGLAVLGTALAAKLSAYVEAGGVIILGPWCGLQDENAKQWEVSLPAHLDHVTGANQITTESFDPIKHPIEFVPRPGTGLPRLTISSVTQQMRVDKSTEVLARFKGHPAGEGLPALTLHRFGRGAVYSLAAFFDEESLARLYAPLLKKHKIQPDIAVPPGVHYARRIGKDFDLHFFFNSSSRRRSVQTLRLEPRTCQVVRIPKRDV